MRKKPIKQVLEEMNDDEILEVLVPGKAVSSVERQICNKRVNGMQDKFHYEQGVRLFYGMNRNSRSTGIAF